MTTNVKHFIEKQIDLIEQENWAELFDIWYNYYAPVDSSEESIQLREFFDITKQAGLGNIEDLSSKDRKDIVMKYLNEYIDKLIYMKEQKVRMVGAVNSLHSRLFHGLLELKSIFIETCEKRGLEPATDTRLSFNLP